MSDRLKQKMERLASANVGQASVPDSIQPKEIENNSVPTELVSDDVDQVQDQKKIQDEISDESLIGLDQELDHSVDEESKDSISEDEKSDELLDQQAVLSKYAEKKINKLYRVNKEKDEQLEDISRELQELRKKLDVSSSAPANVFPDDHFVDPYSNTKIVKPSADQYGSDMPRYIEDMTKFNSARRQAEQVIINATNQQKMVEEVHKVYVNKVANARERHYKDYDSVLQNSNLGLLDKMHLAAITEIEKSEYAPHIAYYLAKRPDLVIELANKSTNEVIKEIGKLEGILEMSMKPNVVSKAPKPLENKSSSGQTKGGSLIDKKISSLTTREWNASIKERMRRGK